MSYELLKVTTEDDWRAYHTLRRTVLWENRGHGGYDENRPAERLPTNHPLLLRHDGAPVGTTRLDDLGDGRGVIRLVAIYSDLQRRGHGRVLAGMVESYARERGIALLLVNADPDAVPFYEKLGWRYFVWDASELTGIASSCIQMTKAILHVS